MSTCKKGEDKTSPFKDITMGKRLTLCRERGFFHNQIIFVASTKVLI